MTNRNIHDSFTTALTSKWNNLFLLILKHYENSKCKNDYNRGNVINFSQFQAWRLLLISSIRLMIWKIRQRPLQTLHLSPLGPPPNLVSLTWAMGSHKLVGESNHFRWAYWVWTDRFELWCWRRLLRVPWTARRSNQSILKEINLEHSFEGLMQKLKLQYFGHLMWRADPLEKTLKMGKIEGKRRDNRGWDGWMASLMQWTWVWANSGR